MMAWNVTNNLRQEEHTQILTFSEIGNVQYLAQRTNRDLKYARLITVRLFAIVQFKDSITSSVDPSYFGLRNLPDNWKKLIFRIDSLVNYRSIMESDLWAGGLSSKNNRQYCFFSALNPQVSDR